MFLIHDRSHRLLVDDLYFAHLLHRINCLCLSALHLPHLPKPTLPNRIKNIEIFATDLGFLLRRGYGWNIVLATFFPGESDLIHLKEGFSISAI